MLLSAVNDSAEASDMDPATMMLLWKLALQLHEMDKDAPPVNVAAISQPHTVDAAALHGSPADLFTGILHCYHPTARYQIADVVQQPCDHQAQYGADGSALVRIRFFGKISGNLYEMKVGVLSKNEPKQIRTAVLSDNAPFMPSSRCQLDRWTGL
jgi:hypothetical protein